MDSVCWYVSSSRGTPKMLLLEQPVDFTGGTVEAAVTGFDVAGCEASHHEDALWEVQGLVTSG